MSILEIIKNKKSVILKNKNTENIIYVCSMAIILWSFLLTSKAIIQTINLALNNKFYTLKEIDKLLYIIGNIQGSILMVPIFLGLILIFRKKISVLIIAISVLLSFNFNSYEFFDNTIHPFLFSLHIYDLILIDGQTSINPQYTKIVFYIIIIITLLSQSVIKKYRSLDKIFLTLILLVVVGTNIIFHIALPLGMLKISRHEAEFNLSKDMSILNNDNICDNKICFNLDSNLKLLNKKNNIDVYKSYSFLFGKFQYLIEASKNNIYTTTIGNSKSKGFDYLVIGMKKEKDNYLVVIDQEILKPVSRHSEIWFSFLIVMVHLFWVYGGMALLFLHKNMALRKLSPRFDKDNKEEVSH